MMDFKRLREWFGAGRDAKRAGRWTVADTEQSIPAKFEQRARLHPEKIALDGMGWQLTFSDLNAAANRHAHAVRSRNEESGGRVALLLPHDASLVAAALGVLKAGKIVVVLNPGDPPSHLEKLRRDAEPELVITDDQYLDLALRAGFSREEALLPGETKGFAESNPGVPIQPGDLAVLIQTSGSTGEPRSVMLTHRNVLHNVLRIINGLGLRAEDRFTLLASLSGGLGFATTWISLLNGATLCPFAIAENGFTGLADWLVKKRITVYTSATSVFRNFVKTLDGCGRFPGIRLVRLGSEPVLPGDFDAWRRHFAGTSVFANAFACSEAGNIAQCLLAGDAVFPGDRIPAGEVSEGIQVRLLDENGKEAPAGHSGEIVVSGDYLSPGYWRNEALTAQRFICEPAAGNRRSFRTGDLGRFDAKGWLTVVGRKAARFKIHGFWVEPADIEAEILRQPGIDGAVVTLRPVPQGDSKLAAFVTPREGFHPGEETIRQALRETLPSYMVPAVFVFMESFPLTPHGKVDRRSFADIPLPLPPPPAAQSLAATATEELLAAIWAGALDRAEVGRDENFFGIGGGSLSAAVISAKLNAAFGVALGLDAFTGNPTIALMAALVDRMRESDEANARPPLVKLPRDGALPISLSQEHVWRTSTAPGGSTGYNMSSIVYVKGPLDVAAFRRAVDHLVARHEMLRTSFQVSGGQPFHCIHPPAPLDLPLLDFTAAPNPGQEAARFLQRETEVAFDLRKAPLLRMWLAKIHDGLHLLLRVSHHLISDAWSWKIFFDELGLLYAPLRHGELPPLPREKPWGYADYASWQRLGLPPGGQRRRNLVSWWKRYFHEAPASTALPFRRAAPVENAPPADGMIWWGLDPALSQSLDELAKKEGATYFMVRMALFTALLALETGRHDLLCGGYVADRPRPEFQDIFGFFVNQTNWRFGFDGSLTFRVWLSRVRLAMTDALAHSELPFNIVCEELRLMGVSPPAITSIFMASNELLPVRSGEIEISTHDWHMEMMPWGFSMVFDQRNESRRCRAMFDARIYEPAGVRAMIGRYKQFAARVSAQPDLPLSKIPRA